MTDKNLDELAKETIVNEGSNSSKSEMKVDSEKNEKTEQERQPWRPASVLKIPARFKNPRFNYRWVTKRKEGNIQKKLREGWVVDYEVMKKLRAANLTLDKTVHDGKDLDTTSQVREMLLMKIPKELAEERNKYYRDKSIAAQNDAQENYEDQINGRGYGNVKFRYFKKKGRR